jgi:hypothetical protein
MSYATAVLLVVRRIRLMVMGMGMGMGMGMEKPLTAVLDDRPWVDDRIYRRFKISLVASS